MQPWDEAEYDALLRITRTAFSSRINAMTDEELDTAGKLAEGLMENEGWALLADMLAWRRSQALRLISHGRVLEQTDYVAATAVVSGVDQSRFVLDAIVDAARERRELAEQRLAEEEEQRV